MLVAAVAAWLLTGVSAPDILLFGAHELGFVLLPGCALYAVLTRRRSGLLELTAAGYAVGSVLEVLAFAATAALHARGALWAYPPLALLAAALIGRGRGLHGPALARSGGDRRSASAWALAAVCIVAIVYIAVAYFLFEPLPEHAASVVYIPDLVFHLGVSAEALHHWPITDPKVVGTPLPYETFLYMKLAVASQITHLALPTLLFRLYIVPLIVALAALLTTAGTIVSGRRAVGVLAAALFLFVGQLGLDPHELLVFYNTVFFSLYDSPTHIFGLVLFAGALLLLLRQLEERSLTLGEWIILFVLLVGCAGAKASILPVIIGGLALLVVWERTRGRSVRAALQPLAIAAVVFAVTYVLIYRGGTGGLTLKPPGSVREMDIVQYIETRLGGAVGGPLFWIVAAVLGLIGFCGATFAGIPAALGSAAIRRARSTAAILALVIASFVPFLLLTHKGGSQNFFTYYGVCAGCLLSAQGLALMWERAAPLAPRPARLLAFGTGAWLIVLIAISVLPYTFTRAPRIGPLYALWIGLPVLVVAALLLARARSGAHRRVLELALAVSVIAVGVLDTPLHTGVFVVPRLRTGGPLYQTDSNQDGGLTAGLQQALGWVRHHTPTNAVLAVNNQFSDAHRTSPDYYYYSAFGQRRVFLEGWEDTIAAASFENPALTPFPRRFFLNEAVFGSADPAALAQMRRRYGVRYLFVDRVHGPVNPRLATLGSVVFSNSNATIYRVS